MLGRKIMKRIHLALVSFGVALLVTGCGGGGSSSSSVVPTAAVQITHTNAPDVAKGAMTPAANCSQTGIVWSSCRRALVANVPNSTYSAGYVTVTVNDTSTTPSTVTSSTRTWDKI
jgi:hypothetical protein